MRAVVRVFNKEGDTLGIVYIPKNYEINGLQKLEDLIISEYLDYGFDHFVVDKGNGKCVEKVGMIINCVKLKELL